MPIQLDADSSSSAWLETVSEKEPKTTEIKSTTKEKTKPKPRNSKKKAVGFGNLDNVEEMMKNITPLKKVARKNSSYNEDSVFNLAFSKKFDQKMDLIDG